MKKDKWMNKTQKPGVKKRWQISKYLWSHWREICLHWKLEITINEK